MPTVTHLHVVEDPNPVLRRDTLVVIGRKDDGAEGAKDAKASA